MTLALLEPLLSDFHKGSVAWLIQRVIEDVAADQNLKQFGESKLASLRVLQRMPFGKKSWASVVKADIIELARELRRKPLKPPTVNQYITFLDGVVIHAMSSFADCEHLNNLAIVAAKPFLRKHNLVAKSERRTRRPSEDEITRLLDVLAKSDQQKNTKIKMVPVVAFGLVSARRRGEVCRITHGDVDYENKIYWVRDLKHPTKKKGNDRSFVLWPELEQIIKMQPRVNPSDPTERIFPYDGKSVGKRYIDAKKRLGITDLRLHDNRGEATSKWLLKLGRDKTRKLVTGHDSEKAFDIYDRRSTEDIMRADEAVQRFLRPLEQRSVA